MGKLANTIFPPGEVNNQSIEHGDEKQGQRMRVGETIQLIAAEPHALRRKDIDVRRGDIGAPISRHVGHYEDDVRRSRCPNTESTPAASAIVPNAALRNSVRRVTSLGIFMFSPYCKPHRT
jgi:hypothetical protein